MGQLFIIGNEQVPDGIILEQCPLFPGKPVSLADLRTVEANLARLGLFVIDRKRGIKPTVKVHNREDDTGGGFRDIQIEVKEKPNVKQLLLLRESIQFVADCRAWGVWAAIYRAEGFPREMLDLLSQGRVGGVPGLIRSRFTTKDKECTGFAPPAAVRP